MVKFVYDAKQVGPGKYVCNNCNHEENVGDRRVFHTPACEIAIQGKEACDYVFGDLEIKAIHKFGKNPCGALTKEILDQPEFSDIRDIRFENSTL